MCSALPLLVFSTHAAAAWAASGTSPAPLCEFWLNPARSCPAGLPAPSLRAERCRGWSWQQAGRSRACLCLPHRGRFGPLMAPARRRRWSRARTPPPPHAAPRPPGTRHGEAGRSWHCPRVPAAHIYLQTPQLCHDVALGPLPLQGESSPGVWGGREKT